MLTSAVHLLFVIPARLGSSRLREKPLRLLGDEPLICHVARSVVDWGFDAPVVVATDDRRVVEAVAAIGIVGVLTRSDHRSGTERVAEVAGLPRFAPCATVVNVQGDHPFLPRVVAEAVLRRLAAGDPIATAAAPLSTTSLEDPHRVKVVVAAATRRALGFSRIPPASEEWPCDVEVLEHVGVYGYTRDALMSWVGLRPLPEEEKEGLEQLRPLGHGIRIGVGRVAGPVPLAVDTEQDLARAEEQLHIAHMGSSG